MTFPNLIVQKFGGATLADPQKIKHAADRVARLSRSHPMIIIVSAMGKTTDSLVNLANQVSPHPHRREMDMLLSVGERISMSLLSMALNDLGCPAISFTGSQAGIMTDDSHVNAFIHDIKPIRVVEALQQKKTVILAGFQGVSPRTKEITTLGRGGSDTTAVAMAAHFKAHRCDILKEVPSVFTADPRLIAQAKPLKHVSYQHLADMTFWGAKVLHYRSAEMALTHKVPLYIGPASDDKIDLKHGTLISEESDMFFESVQFLAVNSHQNVSVIEIDKPTWHEALTYLKTELENHQIPLLQILQIQKKAQGYEAWITGPEEFILGARRELANKHSLQVAKDELSTVTITCTGSVSGDAYDKVQKVVGRLNIPVRSVLCQAGNISFLIPKEHCPSAVMALHTLIDQQN